jgi:hypothetical protein
MQPYSCSTPCPTGFPFWHDPYKGSTTMLRFLHNSLHLETILHDRRLTTWTRSEGVVADTSRLRLEQNCLSTKSGPKKFAHVWAGLFR